MQYSYRPSGVCAYEITFDVSDDGIVSDVHFNGGCNGNGKGIGALAEGMKIDDVIDRLSGIRCGMKSTSCPDQLSKALAQIKK